MCFSFCYLSRSFWSFISILGEILFIFNMPDSDSGDTVKPMLSRRELQEFRTILLEFWQFYTEF